MKSHQVINIFSKRHVQSEIYWIIWLQTGCKKKKLRPRQWQNHDRGFLLERGNYIRRRTTQHKTDIQFYNIKALKRKNADTARQILELL